MSRYQQEHHAGSYAELAGGLSGQGYPTYPAQRRAMACCLGRLDLALQGFSHPAARHDLLWNVSAAHRLMDKLEAVIDPARRRLAEKFMMRFTTQVLPRLGSLRAQVIHNDYHLYNVLVAPDAQDRLTGIIDFGDMIYAPLVGEVATAAAFQMTGCDDPSQGLRSSSVPTTKPCRSPIWNRLLSPT